MTLGPERDIPAPDVCTVARTMAWVTDSYSKHIGCSVASAVAGKPLSIWGSRGRNEATRVSSFHL